ncbi:MAG: hypothetical protein GWP08_21850 [Nitrospiraceae bacterium]|nr:hypothetical protein [Nitrospiraceae bacterium]
MKMDAKEKQWLVEGDARTLIEAQEIMADKKRHAAAIKEVKKQRDAAAAALNPTKKKERKVKQATSKLFMSNKY